MTLLAITLAALLLAGCAVTWKPSTTEAWCLPRAKYSHKTEHVSVGMRCAW